jgi:serralysin
MSDFPQAPGVRWYMSGFAPPGQYEESRKGIIDSDAKWEIGTVIKVSFLGPKDPFGRRSQLDPKELMCATVLRYAREWLTRTGAELSFRPVGDEKDKADIRVAFDCCGSWSLVGTSCRLWRNPNEPTMNFERLQDMTPELVRQVVLHEFGHALGLIHEHQSPAVEIPWNRRRVCADAAQAGWTLEQIERNIFAPAAAGRTQFTAFDPASIMIYPIPREWLLEGDGVPLNTDLSPTDIAFVRAQYRSG